MKFADHPAIRFRVAFGHIALRFAQLHQALDPLFERTITQALPVLSRLLLRLLVQQGLKGLIRELLAQRLQQRQGEAFAAIGKLCVPLAGQLPVVAGAARALGAGGAFNQAFVFQAAQVTAGGLHRDLQPAGDVIGRGLAQAQQNRQDALAGGWLGLGQDGGAHGRPDVSQPCHVSPAIGGCVRLPLPRGTMARTTSRRFGGLGWVTKPIGFETRLPSEHAAPFRPLPSIPLCHG